MRTLPIDLITDIFLRLPAKSLLRFKIVCKSWYNLISDVNFVNHHLKRSIATNSNFHFVIRTPKLHLADFDTFENPISLNYPFIDPSGCDFAVVGSCNGLLCVRFFESHTMFLYNPTTQTYKILPGLPWPESLAYPSFDFGFGFDSTSGDYKCVRIAQKFFKETNSSFCEVMVYSLKTGSWRKGPEVPYYFYVHDTHSALLHETIHWVGNGGGDDRVPLPIVAFNLRDESFSSLPLPEFDAEACIRLHVGVLDGCLGVFVAYLEYIDVWIMKEYEVAGSWKMIFTVAKHQFIDHLEKIVCYSKSGKELIVRNCLLKVATLDLETMKTTNVEVPGFRVCLDAHLCVENLLMLDCDGGDDDDGDDSAEEEQQASKKRQRRRKRKRRSRKRNKRN